MLLLRYVGLVALALWIGGLVALGLGAPVIFDVIQTHDPAAGRTLAGLVFGRVLERFLLVVGGLGLSVLAALGLRAALGPRPRRFALRACRSAAMLTACLAVAFYVTPAIDTIRGGVDGPIAALPDDDTRRLRFGRLHGLSNGLLAAAVVAGIGLLWLEVRDDQ